MPNGLIDTNRMRSRISPRGTKTGGGLFDRGRDRVRETQQQLLARNIQEPVTSGLELGTNVLSSFMLGRSLRSQQQQVDELQNVFNTGISKLKEIADRPADTPEMQKQKLTDLREAENSLINQIPREFQNKELISQISGFRKDFLTGEKLFKPEDDDEQNLAKQYGLSPKKAIEAIAVAKDITSASTIRGKGFANVVGPILERMAQGKTADEIMDEARFAGQSPLFRGTIRDAAQQLTTVLPVSIQKPTMDRIDDTLEKGKLNVTRSLMKRLAFKNMTADESKAVKGSERTVEFLDEIEKDLKEFERKGGDTNIFTGTLEEIAGKVGEVKNKELRKVAVKILAARQKYRRAMTGVAFSPGENLEYDKIFPSIAKTQNFNSAAIEGLREVLQGDVDFFLSSAIGEDAYDKLFKQNPLTIADLQRLEQPTTAPATVPVSPTPPATPITPATSAVAPAVSPTPTIASTAPAAREGKMLIIAPDGTQAYLDKEDAQRAIQKGGRLG